MPFHSHFKHHRPPSFHAHTISNCIFPHTPTSTNFPRLHQPCKRGKPKLFLSSKGITLSSPCRFSGHLPHRQQHTDTCTQSSCDLHSGPAVPECNFTLNKRDYHDQMDEGAFIAYLYIIFETIFFHSYEYYFYIQ